MSASDQRGDPLARDTTSTDLPLYLPGQAIPRDLRTAAELRANGYPVPASVAAWLVEEAGCAERTPLYSTSAARRSRGDGWLRPARDAANTMADGAAGHGGAGNRLPRAGTVRYTPTRTPAPRRASVHGDPRRWLNELFSEGFVIIDTETTGLRARDEIIELAAVTSDGTVLFESRVWPRSGVVPREATRVHGLSIEDLEGAPRWPEVLDTLHAAVSGHRLLAWNAPFDERLSVQSSRAWGVPHSLPGFECAMRAYAYGRGVGSGSFKLERAASIEGVLTGGQTHRSADDAKLTLAVLRSLHRKAGNRA